MNIVPPDISIDFMAMRQKTGVLSGVVVGASLLAVAVMGLNLGIDFKGGSAVIVQFKQDANVERSAIESSVRSLVAAETGDDSSQVSTQDFDVGVTGEDEEVPSRRYLLYVEVTSLVSDAKKAEIEQRIKTAFGEGTAVDTPSEGADTFYLNFPEGQEVVPTYQSLAATFAELGFSQVSVTSDLERQLEIERIGELNLILEEKDRGEADENADDLVLADEAWAKKKAKMLEGKRDKRFTVSVEELKAKVTEKLGADFGEAFLAVESSTSVSPSVGQDLLNNGLLAIFYAIIGILIYITLRFDFRFAPGAVVALIHDVLITLGIFAAFQVKFSLPIIAALLTIVGYSLNDTIVVMDRVRETFDTYRGRDISDLLNRAINETLSRTVLTSITTAFVVASILVMGGGLIRDFALALIIGIVVGTYSSIFVASPLVYYMDQYLTRREAMRAREARGGGAAAKKPAPA